MEVTALTYSGGIGLHGRSPLLRLQSDDRLVALIRRGNDAAFEILVGRYHSRLLAFCRHMLGSREDAEDVLQDVMASAYNAMLSDERPINVRPWLYRIARNRSLNHLRRAQAVGVDSMDVHFHDHGATTADKVHEREEFRLLVGDIHRLPETQRTALVLREMDALSYDQIAEAMETTVPSVKSLLVRARIGLAEAAEARRLSCDEVRIELGEVAEGLQRKPGPLVRRHLKACTRCEAFQSHLRETNKALAVMLPAGPLVLLRKLLITHLGHSAGSSAGAAGAAGASAGAAGAGAGAAAIGAGGSATGLVSAGMGALATKAAAGIAAAALVTAGAVEVDHAVQRPSTPSAGLLPSVASPRAGAAPAPAVAVTVSHPRLGARDSRADRRQAHAAKNLTADARPPAGTTASTTTTPAATTTPTTPTTTTPTDTTTTTTVVTVLPPSEAGTPSSSDSGPAGSSDSGSQTGTTTTPTSTTPTSTTPTPTTPTTTSPTTSSTTPTATTPSGGAPAWPGG